jgi:hypothetical protein
MKRASQSLTQDYGEVNDEFKDIQEGEDQTVLFPFRHEDSPYIGGSFQNFTGKDLP